MDSLVYRQGSMNDLTELKQLSVLAYSEFSKILAPEHWAAMSTNLNNEERLSKMMEGAQTLVCVHNSHIVGMAYLVPSGNQNHIYPSDWAYIRLVGVHPDYRGRGIARTLTRQCIESARVSGERTIGLHTSEIMNAARHIYECLGFKEFKELDRIYGIRYWLYKLEI